LPNVDGSGDPVNVVFKKYFSSELMANGSHKNIVKLIALVVPLYGHSIGKGDSLVAISGQSGRVEPSLD
jgi:hypothetical protein